VSASPLVAGNSDAYANAVTPLNTSWKPSAARQLSYPQRSQRPPASRVARFAPQELHLLLVWPFRRSYSDAPRDGGLLEGRPYSRPLETLRSSNTCHKSGKPW